MGDALIKQKFATGGGGGSGLPAEYQEVTYIQSTGTQYIDTNYTPNQDTRIQATVQLTSMPSSLDMAYFGVREAIGVRAREIFALTNGYIRNDYGSQYLTTSVATSLNKTIIDSNKNVLSINGTTASTASASTFTCPATMPIFCLYNSSTTSYENYSNMLLYNCKVYDNGTLIRNFIPCYRKADNVAGLYDMVGKQFYTNQGTGEFLIGAEVGLLPSEFQQVEYIQSNGTQSSSEYINTGITPAFGDTVKLMATHTAWGSNTNTWMCLFGCQTGNFAITRPNVSTNTYIGVGGSGSYVSGLTPALNTRFYLEVATSSSSTTVSGKYNATSFSITRGTTTPQYNAYIFAFNNSGSVGDYSFIKLDYLKHLRGTIKVRNFIPCYCTTSVTAYQGSTQTTATGGTAGLYDTVEGKFYINSGTGTFAIGDLVFPQGGADGAIVSLIPYMTSDTAPSGVCSGSTLYNSNYHYYNAFQGLKPVGEVPTTTGIYFQSSSYSFSNLYAQYEFVNPHKLCQVTFTYTNASTNSSPNGTAKIQGSLNGSTWFDLGNTQTLSSTSGTYTNQNSTFSFVESECKYIRIYVTQTGDYSDYANGRLTHIRGIQAYGIE